MLKSNLSIVVFLAMVAAGNWLAAHHLVPKPNIEVEVEEVEDNWQLPQFSIGNSAILLNSKLKQYHPWGVQEKTAVVEEKAEKTQQPTYVWKLVGIVGEGENKYILAVNGKTKKIEHYRIAEELPDGSRLLAIYANEVSIEKNSNNATDVQRVKLHEVPKSL